MDRGAPDAGVGLEDVLDLAVERIREAIDASGTGVLLTGRSEGFVVGRPDIDETLRRLVAYAGAGADCLYEPRVSSLDHVAAVVAAVVPKRRRAALPGRLGRSPGRAVGWVRTAAGGPRCGTTHAPRTCW